MSATEIMGTYRQHARFHPPFVLGRFWRVFNQFEQQEFLSLFERYVVLTYSEKLSDYTEDGGGPRVTGIRPESDGVVVFSQIVRGGRRSRSKSIGV